MNIKNAVKEIGEAINMALTEHGFISSLVGALVLENEVDDMRRNTPHDIQEWLIDLCEFHTKTQWDVNEHIEDRLKEDAYLYTCLIGIEKEQEILGENKVRKLIEEYENNIDSNSSDYGECDFMNDLNEIYWRLYSKTNKYVEVMPGEWVDVLAHSIEECKLNFSYQYIPQDYFNLEPIYFMIGFHYIMGEYVIDSVLDNKGGIKTWTN